MTAAAPGLVYLSLSHCVLLSDDGLSRCTASTPLLLGLNLKACSRITYNAVRALDAHCPLLVSLNLSRCHGVSDAFMSVLALAGIGRQLVNLRINHTKITDVALFFVAQNCRALVRIAIANCVYVTQRGISHLTARAKHLEKIRLANCIILRRVRDSRRDSRSPSDVNTSSGGNINGSRSRSSADSDASRRRRRRASERSRSDYVRDTIQQDDQDGRFTVQQASSSVSDDEDDDDGDGDGDVGVGVRNSTTVEGNGGRDSRAAEGRSGRRHHGSHTTSSVSPMTTSVNTNPIPSSSRLRLRQHHVLGGIGDDSGEDDDVEDGVHDDVDGDEEYDDDDDDDDDEEGESESDESDMDGGSLRSMAVPTNSERDRRVIADDDEGEDGLAAAEEEQEVGEEEEGVVELQRPDVGRASMLVHPSVVLPWGYVDDDEGDDGEDDDMEEYERERLAALSVAS
eukprot:ANDGO_01967.mRNA.1 hypothetical protein AMSG_12426